MSDDLPRLKGPVMVELTTAEPADPGQAPDVPEPDPGRAMQTLGRLAAARRGSVLGRAAVWVFGALFSFVLSVSAWTFVTGLLTSHPLLGWIAAALTLLAAGIAAIMALREAAAFARIARLDRMRAAADAAMAAGDLAAARRVVDDLARLYAGRAEVSWGLSRLTERRGEVLDADALIGLAEVEVLAPLDALARAEVEAAARQVATVTALVPLALADVATALVANLRMIRRVAEIYGGRSGTLGSWGLLRRVFFSLLATGALALTDDMIGSFAGGGVLAKLSRRFGEGVVNGALTARVGLAAIDLCRPLAFVRLERPGVSATVSRALAGLWGRAEASE